MTEQSNEAPRIVTGGESLDIYDVMQRFRNDGSCERVIEVALRDFARARVPSGGEDQCTGEPLPEEEVQAAIRAAKERLHWPFAARHNNCRECEREYEAPPTSEPGDLVSEARALLAHEDIAQWAGLSVRKMLSAMADEIERLRQDKRFLGERLEAQADVMSEVVTERNQLREQSVDVQDCDKCDLCEDHHG